ncbi:MAG: biotin transporter BioY [Oscillospiraceae bacterium]|nr:biotin transporter BioY [Oscillospiraceae bacterium]
MKIRRTVVCALFTALISVCSLISIPMPASVPITLATLGVYLCALMLPPSHAVASVAAYLALVAVGIPVTAKGGAGMGYLLGPTGGYLFGYLPLAGVVSLLAGGRFGRGRGRGHVATAAAMAAGTLCCYALGTAWFLVVMNGNPDTHYTLGGALAACVLPFLPGDALKIAASMGLSARLYPGLSRLLPNRPQANAPTNARANAHHNAPTNV